MKVYHYSLRLAHLITTLTHFSQHLDLAQLRRAVGVQATVEIFRNTLIESRLDAQTLTQQLSQQFRCRCSLDYKAIVRKEVTSLSRIYVCLQGVQTGA